MRSPAAVGRGRLLTRPTAGEVHDVVAQQGSRALPVGVQLTSMALHEERLG